MTPGDADAGGTVLFLDTPSGVAGDMLVAALLDAGAGTEDALAEALVGLGDLGAHRLVHGSVRRSGIEARRFDVVVDGDQPHRTYRDVRRMIEQAETITDGARTRALTAFRRLAEAEARVHRAPIDEVHFHEVGATDSIVDIVGTAVLVDLLGPDRVVSTPLPMTRGFVDAQHGALPLPAPATVLCLEGVPTVDGGLDGVELVTPTGACLVATMADSYARWPGMRPTAVGWGGGSLDLPDRPNLLRVVVGRSPAVAAVPATGTATHVVIAANVDDSSPEVLGHAMERLFRAGALDAWTAPIGMKKSRPGVTVSAVTTVASADAVAAALLTETTTLGVRITPAGRLERPRRVVTVETPYGPIPVKRADGDGLPAVASPELEACRAAAEAHDVPVREVLAAALAAARGSAP